DRTRPVVRDAGRDQPDGAGAPGDEGAGGGGGAVAQLRDGLLDAGAGGRAHVRQVVEHARHGLVRHPREARHIEDVGSACPFVVLAHSPVTSSSGRATIARSESTVSESAAWLETSSPPRITSTRFETRSTSSSSAEMNITERPLSASSVTRFWISTFAPTSMPLVGSSSTSTRGASASSRASKIG